VALSDIVGAPGSAFSRKLTYDASESDGIDMESLRHSRCPLSIGALTVLTRIVA